MTPDRIYFVLSVAAFVPSCVLYRREHKVGGDRLLFLAYGMMLCGYAVLFHSWGLI